MENTILQFVLAGLPIAWVVGRSLDRVFAHTIALFHDKVSTTPVSVGKQLEHKLASDFLTKFASF